MSCYRPLEGYRTSGGSVKIGYEPPGSTEKLRIPCGSCFGCRMEYAEQWSIRCRHEAACWDSNLFLTLTYDDDSLEWHRSLVVDHLQAFLKRLRKRFSGVGETEDGKRPVRYFAAGEYGSRTDRPHFHLLLFNLRIPDVSGFPDRNEESAELSELWKFGRHVVSGFSPGRARYVAGYAAKKVKGRMARQAAYGVYHPVTGEYFERKPEFCTMSRRPGLGHYWYERFRSDLERGYVVEAGGVKKRLPRFYKERLLSSDDFAMADEERRDAYISSIDAAEDTPERNAVKERVHKARIGAHGRERSF